MYAQKRDSGPPLFHLLPRERFRALDSAELYMIRPGVIRVRAPVRLLDHLNEEDRAQLERDHDSTWLARLASPVGRGDSLLWVGHCTECGERVSFEGRAMVVYEFWTEPGPAGDTTAPAVLERPLEREWWVRIGRDGRTGWIQAFGHNLAGSDLCSGTPLP